MFARQFGGVDRLALGPRMTLRDNDLERLLVEEFGGNARRLEGQRDDRCVDAAGLESSLELLGDVFLDFQRHIRCQRVERRNKIGQQVRRHRVDRAQSEQPRELVAAGLRDIADARRFFQHLVGLLDDALADRRHRDLALSPLEELCFQLFLQLLNRH